MQSYGWNAHPSLHGCKVMLNKVLSNYTKRIGAGLYKHKRCGLTVPITCMQKGRQVGYKSEKTKIKIKIDD